MHIIAGNDTIYSEGNDTLLGGAGDDLFVFNVYFPDRETTIKDFTVGEDTIFIGNGEFFDRLPKPLEGASQVGDDVVVELEFIDYDKMSFDTFTITLENVALDDLTEESFIVDISF